MSNQPHSENTLQIFFEKSLQDEHAPTWKIFVRFFKQKKFGGKRKTTAKPSPLKGLRTMLSFMHGKGMWLKWLYGTCSDCGNSCGELYYFVVAIVLILHPGCGRTQWSEVYHACQSLMHALSTDIHVYIYVRESFILLICCSVYESYLFLIFFSFLSFSIFSSLLGVRTSNFKLCKKGMNTII